MLSRFFGLLLISYMIFLTGVANAAPVSDTPEKVSNSTIVTKIKKANKPKAKISIKGENIKFKPYNLNAKNSVAESFPDKDLTIIGKAIYGDNLIIWDLPREYQKVKIEGKATATKDQAVALMRLYNMDIPLDASAEDLVEYYYSEATRENIKWDEALCQALVETGFFHFGGTVIPEQNNFCGLGTTSQTEKGAFFLTPQMGVRAHIQHLVAYIRPTAPSTEIIDPRYEMVRDLKKRTGYATYWYDLNGKWAMGSEYAEKILDIHEQMKKIVTVHGKLK